MMDPRLGLVLGFTFIRCTETPPHGGGDAGEAGSGGSAAHGGTTSGSAGHHQGGAAPSAGQGGSSAGQAGSATGEGGRADGNAGASVGGVSGAPVGGEGGSPVGGEGGLPLGGEGGSPVGGEGGLPLGGEGGLPVGGEGGLPVGGEGGSPIGGEGGSPIGGEGGSPIGGEGGSAELPCVFDLLPDVGFAPPTWSESTSCTPFPGATCPNPPPPVIVNGQARFSGSGRPGGSAWSQSVSTIVRIPSDAISVVISGIPGAPDCPLPGANASLTARLNGMELPRFQPVSVVPWRGQDVTVSITFTQTSGSPCSATVTDVSLQLQRCAQ